MATDIVILGSTGSIGTQTLEVIQDLEESHQKEFNVVGLGCGTSTDLLIRQIDRFKPDMVSVKGEPEKERVSRGITEDVEIRTGREGLNQLARMTNTGTVINSLVGFVGLEPTLKAIGSSSRLLLANKESLVVGGPLVNRKLSDSPTSLIPIDSEHNAIFQALETGKEKEVERLIITASGGPFLSTPLDRIEAASPEEALDHPNWDMGNRITCDSASMVNKGLEVIEAHWLFDIPYERISAVIHPQSVIHSLVQFSDGSMIGELGEPDMKIPIQYALTYPRRMKNDYDRTDLVNLAKLEFKKLEEERYPAFNVVVEAGKSGGNRPAAVNGADEALIDEFLAENIRFGGIARGLELVLEDLEPVEKPSFEDLQSTDTWARKKARYLVEQEIIGDR
ncbi:1-deoxy-D-xylulose-5-phosphate reductoisomerase [Candidatus Bipolaricaulota bacterium]|nr:1-deoxy-D-xylulose-5-phosphate reductoisomerase [Candidatus Bipolaricaulota bacterium]